MCVKLGDAFRVSYENKWNCEFEKYTKKGETQQKNTHQKFIKN